MRGDATNPDGTVYRGRSNPICLPRQRMEAAWNPMNTT